MLGLVFYETDATRQEGETSANSALFLSNNLFSLEQWNMASQGDWRRIGYFWTPQSQLISVCLCACARAAVTSSLLFLGLDKILQKKMGEKRIRQAMNQVCTCSMLRPIPVTLTGLEDPTGRCWFFCRTGIDKDGSALDPWVIWWQLSHASKRLAMLLNKQVYLSVSWLIYSKWCVESHVDLTSLHKLGRSHSWEDYSKLTSRNFKLRGEFLLPFSGWALGITSCDHESNPA